MPADERSGCLSVSAWITVPDHLFLREERTDLTVVTWNALSLLCCGPTKRVSLSLSCQKVMPNWDTITVLLCYPVLRLIVVSLCKKCLWKHKCHNCVQIVPLVQSSERKAESWVTVLWFGCFGQMPLCYQTQGQRFLVQHLFCLPWLSLRWWSQNNTSSARSKSFVSFCPSEWIHGVHGLAFLLWQLSRSVCGTGCGKCRMNKDKREDKRERDRQRERKRETERDRPWQETEAERRQAHIEFRPHQGTSVWLQTANHTEKILAADACKVTVQSLDTVSVGQNRFITLS